MAAAAADCGVETRQLEAAIYRGHLAVCFALSTLPPATVKNYPPATVHYCPRALAHCILSVTVQSSAMASYSVSAVHRFAM